MVNRKPDGSAEKTDAPATNMSPATLHIVQDNDNAQDLPVFLRGIPLPRPGTPWKRCIAGVGFQTAVAAAISFDHECRFPQRRAVEAIRPTPPAVWPCGHGISACFPARRRSGL